MFIGDIFMLAHAKLKTKRIMTLMAILIAGVSLFYVKNITATFIGFNLEIVKIIGAILLLAPIVSILTLDQLSIKTLLAASKSSDLFSILFMVKLNR